jgi:uncharacterized protein YndB with AHSA1/START domain
MKILKGILISIAALIALVLFIALFIKKDYVIEREVVINRPEAEVFDYIKYIKNQDNYSKWNMADPNKKTEERGTDGTVGYVYKWDGNDDVGAGEQEITRISEGERIDMELRFKRPMESTANAFMSTEPASPISTKVKWGMYGTSSYPMNFMNFMMDGMLGSDLETGLQNLKTVLEK